MTEAKRYAGLTTEHPAPTFLELFALDTIKDNAETFVNIREDGPDHLVDAESLLVDEVLDSLGLEYDEDWEEIEGWADLTTEAEGALWLHGIIHRLQGFRKIDPAIWEAVKAEVEKEEE